MDDLSLSAQRWLCQSFLCISWLYNLSVIPHLIGFALSMDDMTDLSLSRMTGVPGIVMRMMTMGTQGPTRVTRVTGTAGCALRLVMIYLHLMMTIWPLRPESMSVTAIVFSSLEV